MKKFLLCPLALLVFAGCNQSEPETAAPIVVVSPTLAPTAATSPAPPKNKTIIIVPPAAKTAPKANVIVIKPPLTSNDKIAIKPPPGSNKNIVVTPTSAPVAKPTAKPEPAPKQTAKPIIKPAPKPIVKPTAKPMAKPQPTKIALAQIAPTLIVRAQVISTSKVPDPSTVAYSDSLVFSKYRVISVEKGAYEPQEILVAQWGMKGKKLTPAARLRAGDGARLQLVPLDEMPKLDRIMRNDDTGDYDSTPYFALEK